MSRRSQVRLTELSLLQNEIGLLFERLVELQKDERPAGAEWLPPVDVLEADNRLVVSMEVPGLAVEALSVVCRDGQLIVSGERRVRRSRSRAAAFLCVERPHGRFRRSFTLDGALDLRKAEARLEAGVLTISLPRLRERRRQELEIPIRKPGA